jgi:hypothetical protein
LEVCFQLVGTDLQIMKHSSANYHLISTDESGLALTAKFYLATYISNNFHPEPMQFLLFVPRTSAFVPYLSHPSTSACVGF